MNTVLISPSFTSKAALLIQETLTGYSVEQPKEWAENTSVNALIVRSKDLVNQEFINMFPNLEIVVSATSGFDHFDLNLSAQHKFCYSPNANVNSAAELTILHMLSFFKNGKAILSKNWDWRSTEFLGEELSGKKVSLIGLGRIGTQVSKVLNAFGCEVFAYDPYIEEEDFKSAAATSVNFETALEAADILSLHCPLTKKTRDLINFNALSHMKRDAFLINCARGGIVNTNDLASAVERHRIAGACLDVFEIEPLSKGSPLRQLENILISPHVGGYTLQAQKKSALEAAKQIKGWFEDKSPKLNTVPPNVAWAEDL